MVVPVKTGWLTLGAGAVAATADARLAAPGLGVLFWVAGLLPPVEGAEPLSVGVFVGAPVAVPVELTDAGGTLARA